jgi:TetR/AcrR family transcriptional regulator, regulator of autoinduction and epiphytic fitness
MGTDHRRVDPSGSSTRTDGRRLRREQNRDAVVEALLTMYDAGNVEPSIAEVADAAGLSARSVFRYFDDVDDLTSAAISHQRERLAALAAIDLDDVSHSLDERVERFVAHRVRLVEAMGQVGRVARHRALTQPLVAAELDRIRASLRHQLAEVFAAELAEAAGLTGDAAERLAAADVACSFEAYELLRRDQGLDRAAAARAMTTALLALLAGSGHRAR